LSASQIAQLGFGSIGSNTRISNLASLHGAERIYIGDNVRIDDFCILSAGSGGIYIGSYVHVAAFCSIIGQAEIRIEDFAGLSARVSIHSSSDDYSGETMTNPTVPDRFRNVDIRPVSLGRHVIIGSGSVVLPGVTMGEGAAVGALSLVTRPCDPFSIYSGVPARRIGSRSRKLLDAEQELRGSAAM
jgi:galactoside O-acetyltransferase